jgi:hypothetical protein
MYEYKIVSFEFANASTTFQTYINVALRKYFDVFVFVYINDIFIFFKILEKHERHVHVVLERLLQYKLYVNIKKSEFNVIKMTFLSFIIIRDDVKMNLNKIEMIVNWSESHSHKNVQIFLKFVNFYRRFIKEFFRIANALSALLKKNDKNKFHIFFWIHCKCEEIIWETSTSFFHSVVVSSFRFKSKNQAWNKRVKFRYFRDYFSIKWNDRAVTFYNLLIQKNDVCRAQLRRKRIWNIYNYESVQTMTTLC